MIYLFIYFFYFYFRFHGMNRTLFCISPSSLTAWVQIVVVIQFLSPVGIHLIPTSGPTTLNASHTFASCCSKLINNTGYFKKTLWIRIVSGLNSHIMLQ